MTPRALLWPLLVVLALWLGAPAAQAQPFSVIILGDQPYDEGAAAKARFRALVDAINAAGPDLVIHVGDTKAGRTRCSDEVLAERRGYLDAFAAPTLYTPGDNEWTDCHRIFAGAFDPAERLDHIRETYFAEPGQSFGQSPLALHHQGAAGYPENARVMFGQVMVMTAHVVGSNNNFEATRPSAAAEFAARDAANRAWLKDSFAAARAEGADALILAIHGDMFDLDFGTVLDPEAFRHHSGFAPFAETLIWEAGSFARPVLLAFGDGHHFGLFQPLPRRAPNILALETFGDGAMHAVRVEVTPDAAYPFAVQPFLNPE